MARITVRLKGAPVKDVSLDKPVITIGRSRRNDIIIDDMGVSRRHARIYREGPRFIIEDLKSLNGTFVNGRKVSQWILSNDDEILIGKSSLVFVDEEEEPPGPRASERVSGRREAPALDKLGSRPRGGAGINDSPAVKGSRGIQAWLTVVAGGSGEEKIELTKPLIIAGKGDRADIKLKGLFVGKTAFLISRRPSGFAICPSGGRTTVRVNGVHLNEEKELKDGDIISAGKTTMQFRTKG